MRSGALAGMLVGLALGLGLGWWLRGSELLEDAPPATTVSDRGEQPVADVDTPPPAPAATTSAPTEGPALHGTKEIRGEGVIRGAVTTADGEPVEGVRVTAELNDPALTQRLLGAGGQGASLEEELRLAAEAIKTRRAARVTVLTSADGTYALTGLIDTRFNVTASKDGFVASPAPGAKSWGVPPGGTIDFRVRAVVKVRITVLRSDGAAVESATITLAKSAEERRGRRLGWHAIHPETALDVGTWWISAESREERGTRSAPVEVRCEPGHAPAALTLHLGGEPGLRGRVVFADGVKAPRYEVWARTFEGDEPPTYDRMSRRQWKRASSRDGTYAFKDIVPGRYALAVEVANTVQHQEVVHVGSTLVTHDLRMPPMDLTRYVRTMVAGPDGKPLDRIRFRLKFDSNNIHGGGPLPALQGSGGTWWLELAGSPLLGHAPKTEGKRYPVGRYVLHASHPEYGELRRTFDPNETKSLEFRFEAAMDVDVTVAGLAASRVRDLTTLYVGEQPEESSISLGGRGFRPRGDTFSLTNVQPGTVWLRLVAQHRLHGIPTFATLIATKVDLRPDAPIRLALPELHALELSFDPDLEPGSLALIRTDGSQPYVQNIGRGKEGRIQFRFIPPGRYRIQGTWPDEGRTPIDRVVDIPAETHIKLTR